MLLSPPHTFILTLPIITTYYCRSINGFFGIFLRKFYIGPVLYMGNLKNVRHRSLRYLCHTVFRILIRCFLRTQEFFKVSKNLVEMGTKNIQIPIFCSIFWNFICSWNKPGFGRLQSQSRGFFRACGRPF